MLVYLFSSSSISFPESAWPFLWINGTRTLEKRLLLYMFSNQPARRRLLIGNQDRIKLFGPLWPIPIASLHC